MIAPELVERVAKEMGKDANDAEIAKQLRKSREESKLARGGKAGE